MKLTAKEFSQSFATDSQCSKQRQKHDPVRNKTESLEHSPVVPAENDEFLAALDKIRERAGINSNDVSDRIVCQAGTALLGHWQPKAKSVEEKIITAANALAEMKPTNATELMLAGQMLAVNDAVFLFMSQATLDDSSFEKRDFYMERAARLMDIYVQQVDCMMRLKGMTGRQRVTVEHVHVHRGGQAIVGTVAREALDKGEGDGRANRWNTPCKAARVAKKRQSSRRLQSVPSLRSEEPTRELLSVSSDEQRAV
jgi:hypothetical protein